MISYVDRCSALALVATKLALESAGVLDRTKRTGDWGLAYSSAWGCLDSMELFFAKVAAGQAKFAPPLVFSHSYVNTPSSLACIEFGLSGPGATFSQGASGAIVALGWARDRLVRTGGAECAGFIAAASDSLSKALRRHYASAGELSADGALLPFDPQSTGTVLGEAGAALAVEIESPALSRGAKPLAAILGWSSSLGQSPEKALTQAVRQALEESGVKPGSLSAVFADASGRPELDRAEGAALDVAVGKSAPRRTVKSRAGECGPASALLSASEVLSAAPGTYLVTALDRSGSAALVLERKP